MARLDFGSRELAAMSATISVTESAALAIMRSFILNVIPGGSATPPTFECVKGQINRTPEPTYSDFATMTPLMRERIATNINTYQDNVTTGYKNSLDQIQLTVQVDFHGPNSGDNCSIFSTLWRDSYATDYFLNTSVVTGVLTDMYGNIIVDSSGNAIQVSSGAVDAAPLYCSEPRQMPFENGESQVEYRWTIDAEMQINPVISTTQQFAAQLAAAVISVDVVYPP